MIGYFEAIDSERGIARRAADSLALRDFLGVGLEDTPRDHSTISRTRRLIDLETHRAVFTWVLQCLSAAGLVKGKTIGIDATALEANAALRSIVRRGRATRGGRRHLYATGGLRRMHARGHVNARKRLLVQAGACNVGLWMRTLIGVGTPRDRPIIGRPLRRITVVR